MKNGKRIHSITTELLVDSDPDTSYLEQEGFEDRLSQYERGLFAFVGVRAKAEICIPVGQDHGLIQTITSGGLWGIEDDSSAEYMREVTREQMEELKDQLHALGFSKRAINAAFRKVSRG